jgi:hypothetical protein
VGLKASVREHLNALEAAPEWVVSLGEMIQQADGCSAAIAASRARDLSQRKDIGGAIEGIARGWEILSTCDLATLTPLQRETIELVMSTIAGQLETGLLKAGRMKT